MKEKFENFLEKESIIVFDTNVFLNLYEYSPEVADTFIEAIYFVKEKIYIPSTVKREFFRNHSECSGRKRRSLKIFLKS